MKTKDAFALRDFDEKNIFSRPFFQCCYSNLIVDINYESDLENAFCGRGNELKFATTDGTEYFLEKDVKPLGVLLKKYWQLIKRHVKRLKKFWSTYGRYIDRGDENFRIRYERVAWLLRQYSWYEEIVEDFNRKYAALTVKVIGILGSQYKKEFGKRLAEARRAAGFTQKDLAEQLGITPSGYARYEQGRVDLPMASLKRFVQVTECSVEKLLGLVN